jgi:hypothetical protein
MSIEAAQTLPADVTQLPASRPKDKVCFGGSHPAKTGKLKLLTLDQIDGRTYASRRARDLIEAILRDIGDDISEGTRQLVQRAGVLGAFIEDSETRWLNGEGVDFNNVLAAINAQRRILATLGLERRLLSGPSLGEYITTKQGAAALPEAAE